MLKRFFRLLRPLAVIYLSILLLIPTATVHGAQPQTPRLLISEIQTGSTQNSSEEFVELHNASSEIVDVTGWQLEYKSASGTTWVNKATLNGQIQAESFYLLSTADYLLEDDKTMSSGLAASGGAIRLVDPNKASEEQVNDLVGWGNADTDNPAVASSPGESIQRCFEDDSIVDTGNNSADFAIYEATTPGEGVACSDESSSPAPNSGVSCDGVIISEVLPNPSGADSGQEFIELHNPTTDFIPLEDCGLQTSSSSKIYTFSSGELTPGEYQAFYNNQTGLTLPNSSGGTVYLLSPDEAELSSVIYKPDMDDDTAWALFGSGWKTTYSPTPGAANALQATKPCPAGQERSADTGRCRGTDAASSSLKPCAAGKERNPATNRCRSILGSASQLVPCKAGQERNPATNRCRKIGSGASTLKPCRPGQERNPATNRCRLIAGIDADNPTANVAGASTPAAIPNSPVSTGLVATAAGLALLYGLYEFRYDIRNRFQLAWQYFKNRHHSGP